jgi:hypothetical protein
MRSHGDTGHRASGDAHGDLLCQPLQGKDIRIVALKSDIESGQYTVKAEQVAEKIMKNLLLALFYY